MTASGPAPWIELGLALGLVLAAVLAWRVVRRRARRPAPAVRPDLPGEGTESARERMIAWSVAIRESLAVRFGPAWRAKTTEEIAGDPRLAAALGAERTARLLEFLAAADRAKFAGSDEAGSAIDVSEAELRELTESVVAAGPAVEPGLRGQHGLN